ncbi:MAG: hypothetical protein COA32_08445 [Fluviicola sp.]|nr:MAG: hypothetical protein COA32_08445 [Fluviicola sp.]
MTNNDILRRIRYLFNYSDTQVVELFKLAECDVEEAEVSNWLKKDDDPNLVELSDKELATFLNGLIIQKRGKREGPQPEPEEELSNNMILMKLKIALKLKSEDIIDLFALVDRKVGKSELSAFLRSADHNQYRPLKGQYLRNFLTALQRKSKKSKDVPL